MKLFPALLIALNIIIINNNAYALAEENIDESQWSTSIGTRSLLLRRAFNNDHMIYFGGSYSLYKYDSGSFDRTDQRYGVVMGYSYYFDKSSIHSFMDSTLNYIYSDYDNIDNIKNYGLEFTYGLENLLLINLV